jgi:hypothetical protein
MIFSHKGLEVSGGDMVWATLMGPPLDKEAVGDTAKHAQDPDAIITLHAAAVIVVGHVQALMEAAFDAPTLPVEIQPQQGWQQ